MNKILSILIVFSLLTGCKGEQGNIGPEGQTGDTGTVGPNGQTGAKGETGSKGVTGAPGIVGQKGDTGVTPNVKVYYTDWENMTGWTVAEADPYKYLYKKNPKQLSFIPNYSNLRINYFSDFGGFVMYNSTSSEPVGTLYIYNAVKSESGDVAVFNEDYYDKNCKVEDTSNGTAYTENLTMVPVISQFVSITLSKGQYPSGTNLQSVITNLTPKSRMVFIPQGLASGRLKALTYEQMLKAFEIPTEGASR